MKAVLILLMGLMLHAEVFLLDRGERIAFTPLESGVIDFAALPVIARHLRSDKTVKTLIRERDFNRRHLNFRFTTLQAHQVNTVLTENTKALGNDTYEVTFGDIHPKDGVMLQLQYRNRWYGIILGEPLAILHANFRSAEASTKSLHALAEALKAYPEDPLLHRYYEAMKHELAKRKAVKGREVIDFKNPKVIESFSHP